MPSFLVPAFLAGLAALAIPIVIHLRHREWEKPHRFPSLMFLRRIPIRTARRRRITDWLLLALRAAAVALLVLAFSRPFFRREASAAVGTRSRAVVVLLDRSLSMGHREVWPRALDSANAVVRGLGATDRVAVIRFDEQAEVAQALTVDHGAALAAISATRVTSRGTRYAAGLRAARQALASAGEPGEVVVVTDLQRSGLAGLAGVELPAGTLVRAAPVTAKDRSNAAVIGADVQRLPAGERSELRVTARVNARDLAAPRAARLSLVVEGRAAGTREVTLGSAGVTTVSFDPVPLATGRVRAVIALDADALPADDTLRVVVPAEQGLRVLLVGTRSGGTDDMLFTERALGIGREPRFTVERRQVLDPAALRGASIVVLDDTRVPDGPTGAALDRWVGDGGGLVIMAGPRIAGGGGAGLMPGTGAGMVERLGDGGGSFGEVLLDHPVFAPFREAGTAVLGAARFLRYPKLTPAEGSQVLARFDDGAPLLVERARGEGRALLLAAPLDNLTGDFPLQPGFLPFIRRLAMYAAGHQVAPLWRTTGETGIVPGGVKDPVVATPGGELIRPASDSAPCTVVLEEAGFYQTYASRAAGEPLDIVAVNPPALESDLTPADPRELLIGVRQADSTAAAARDHLTAVEQESRQGIWRLLLLAVAVLLLLEALVANRGWRGTAATVLPAAPERKAP
jgi:hypothetical protein